ncbi:RNA 2',3'-cyclic phosphodiesterase [Pseudomonas sp. NPDC090202]|uniref:RNA 2',3'-cyclic phosphodiesterase n=1 Tax=unclassified Pseudomonas TaxID=196821 RepID=UPI00381EFAE1
MYSFHIETMRKIALGNESQSRLFFALGCPPALRKAISQWRTSLSLRVGRPVPAANFHLTLLFLGAVDTARIAEICDAASSITVPGRSLTVELDRLEVWRRSGALVLAPADPPPELMRLSYALEQAMLPFGHDQDQKEFRPHLTLTRDYRLPVPEADSPPEFLLHADRFILYQSHKGQYRAIGEWPLI